MPSLGQIAQILSGTDRGVRNSMRLWLSLELHILARVFGNGFDPDRDGLVSGMRDLQRQCLELKW